ncbi:MAG: PilZ domain-containing protein [Candidatus Omnitrophica bacterium]|nr:PilZ domain-containing protein [Candidatus Omnitrophota bacterium]
MAKKTKASLKVKLNVNPSSKGRFNILIESAEAKALDISVSGIGLLSELFLPRGAILDLELRLHNETIKTKGQIRSAVSVGKGLTRLGIKLIDLGKSKTKIIKRFIKENEKRLPTRLKLTKEGLFYGKKNKH